MSTSRPIASETSAISPLSATDALGTQTGDRTGVRVRNSTGTFDYVVVYSH